MEWLKLGIDGIDDSELLNRPKTRADCERAASGPDAGRPCPWVGCRHHMFLDVNPETGSITFNFPGLEPWELPHTCVLDLADRGGMTLEEIGEDMNITRERVRQIEVRALVYKVKPEAIKLGLNEIEIGISHYTAMAEIENVEPGYNPSEVTFQNG